VRLRFFEKYYVLGSNISIASADLLEVWRKQKGFRQKENTFYTFISGHFSDSKLDFNERYLKENARMFSVNLFRNLRKCYRN